MPRGITNGDIICPGCDKRLRAMRRYPFAPLAAFVGMSEGQTARHLDLSGSTQKAARCHGLSRNMVETVCGKLGCHPAEVWSEIVDHDIEDASKECPGCGDLFLGHPNQRYCSKRCGNRARNRAWQNKRYASDDEYRAQKVEYQRLYREASRRADSLYRKRYREKNREKMARRQRAHYLANREEILAKQRIRDRARRAA